MVIRKQEGISILLKNFVGNQQDIKVVFLYSRQGLLMSKYGRMELDGKDDDEIEQVHGAISGLVETLLNKISMEYKTGHFGTGSFETPDNRIIFLEAGHEAILLCVCDFDANLNKLFPVAYLVIEKIAQLLEESFDYRFNSLDIPELTVHEDFSLKLDKNYATNATEPLFDGVYLKHHIKRKEAVKKVFKLIILGDAAVGKTSLVNSFLKKEQISDYRPTLGISISTQKYYIAGFKDDQISFLVYDLAGQDFFKRVRHEYYNGANCAFIVYDITRRKTFEEGIDFWFNDAKKKLGDIPFVLIGNKLDLKDQREVSQEEGKKKAEELRTFYTETAALYNINVQDTFKLIGIGLFFKKGDDDDDDIIRIL